MEKNSNSETIIPPSSKSTEKRRFPSKKLLVFVAFALLLSLMFVYLLVFPLLRILKENELSPRFLMNLVLTHNSPLKKHEGRTNLLLLGIPGEDHQGADLTDSMIFMSVNFQNNDVLMVSLPRDIWLPSLKDKLNTAYHYGEEKKEDGGFILAKEVTTEIVGQPVHYVLLVDFTGFKELIDLVGGLPIYIERSFVDRKYPIPGRENDLCNKDPEFRCRYETVSFEKGWEHMDGERALKFVRSRNSEEEEGTDFAREKRQQKVIAAFQKKLLSLENLKPARISILISALKETIKTDLSLTDATYLAKFGLFFKDEVRTIALDSGKKDDMGFLVHPQASDYNGRWVLVPRTGDFSEIHNFISCHIKDPNCPISP